VLSELRPLLVESNDLALCRRLFADSFAHHVETYPTGVLHTDTADMEGGGFTAFHLYILAHLHTLLGAYDASIHTVRFGMRWLQGRSDQVFWDTVPDDHEYDVVGLMLRPPVSRARGAAGGETGDDGPEAYDVEPGSNPLDVNAHGRLAVARLKLGHVDEVKVCRVWIITGLQIRTTERLNALLVRECLAKV